MRGLIQTTPAWMAQTPIVFVGAASSTSVTVTLPAGVQDGDLMIGFGYENGASVPSTPSGWTLIDSDSDTYAHPTYGNKSQAAACWSRVAASEGSTITLAGDICGVAIYRNTTGVDSYSAFAWCGFDELDPATITIPEISPANGGYLLGLTGYSYGSPVDMNSKPSGMSELTSNHDTGGDAGLYIYSQSINPGATGEKTFTLDGHSGAADEPALGGVLVAVY